MLKRKATATMVGTKRIFGVQKQFAAVGGLLKQMYNGTYAGSHTRLNHQQWMHERDEVWDDMAI